MALVDIGALDISIRCHFHKRKGVNLPNPRENMTMHARHTIANKFVDSIL